MLLQLRIGQPVRTETNGHLLQLLVPAHQDIHLSDLVQGGKRSDIPLLGKGTDRYMPRFEEFEGGGRNGIVGVFIQKIQFIYC